MDAPKGVTIAPDEKERISFIFPVSTNSRLGISQLSFVKSNHQNRTRGKGSDMLGEYVRRKAGKTATKAGK